MDSIASWQRFFKTGNIGDYLKYVDTLKVEARELEQNRERNSDKGNGIQGERPSYYNTHLRRAYYRLC